ncbi:hypothetical protein DFP72DRAFT_863319 [Ephemerocybe angulata]|uniref:Uncharacterized protein n=1 Tax=Ephemerocybe angulata TaxID=980116 RepID=A0A8H6H7Z8_9AGAR|nr:hypothetical protein DFP72DRAFT_863319 [Tulosesus angulatus]
MRSGMKATTAQIPPPARMLTFPTSRLSDLHIHYRTQDVLDSLEDEDARNNDEITEAATTCTLARFAQPSGFASHNIRRRARTVMMGSLKTKAAAKHTGHRAAPSRTRSDGTAVFFLPFSNDIVQQHGAKKVKCANCPATFDRGSQLTRHSASCRPAKPASPRATAAAQIAPRINPSYLKTVPPYPEHVKRHQCPKNVHYCSPAPLLYNAQKPNSSTAMLHNQARDKLEVPQSQDGGMNITSSRTHPPHPKALGIEPPGPAKAQPSRVEREKAKSPQYGTSHIAGAFEPQPPAQVRETTSPDLVVDLMLQKAPRSRRSHVASAFETHPPAQVREPALSTSPFDLTPHKAQPVKRKRTISTGSTALPFDPNGGSTKQRLFPLPALVQKKARTDSSAKAPIPPPPAPLHSSRPGPCTLNVTDRAGGRSASSIPIHVIWRRYSLAYNTQHNLFICTSCQSALTSSNLLVHLKDTEKFTISREAGDKLQVQPKPRAVRYPSQDAILKEFTDFAPQAPPTVEIPADKRLINPWILQTGFHLYVQGHNVAELRAAAKLPTTEETHLKDLSKRVVELIMDSNSLIDGTSHPLRRRIYTVDPAQLERTPLKSHQEQSTNSNYGNLIAHLVAAIVRGGTSTLRFPTTPRYSALYPS